MDIAPSHLGRWGIFMVSSTCVADLPPENNSLSPAVASKSYNGISWIGYTASLVFLLLGRDTILYEDSSFVSGGEH